MLQCFNLKHGSLYVILDCQNFKLLVASQVGKANAHFVKIGQMAAVIAFNGIQNSSQLPSWI